MRKRRRRSYRDCTAGCALCFGLGLVLSMFCSPRFALFLAAVALVCLAVNRRC